MKKRKNTAAKIFAFVALFGIILGVIGTGALFIFGNSQTREEKIKTINPEKLQELIENQTNTGIIK